MHSTFMDDDFLLDTEVARQLYHGVAKELPIIDYHSHLIPREIAGRRKFSNLAELWLGGDHYKWRLMRSSGVTEDFITGSRTEKEKFDAFCKILPLAIGNPIYHWSHLELRRIFGIDLLINAANADEIWARANARLAQMDTWSFLEQANVEIACTTDDPADDLAEHAAIAKSGLKTRVIPAYRPDGAMSVNSQGFAAYLDKLSASVGFGVNSFDSLMHALIDRVDYFHQAGARISDHAIDFPLPESIPDLTVAEQLFSKRLRGELLSSAEIGQYHSAMLERLGRAYAERRWTMCLHIGALRDVNSRMVEQIGQATGYDSITDFSYAGGVAALLNGMERDDQLPKTMLFCLNSSMNEVIATMIGNFQAGPVKGKIQYGPAWWFNDHKEGNLQQFITLANLGSFGTSVGMVTDSRSFASYPRHDYYRRLLCRQLGNWVSGGEYPNDSAALATIVRGICYENARDYFGM